MPHHKARFTPRGRELVVRRVIDAGETYPPVVREEPTGDEAVTWGEFVETRLLSEYQLWYQPERISAHLTAPA